MRKKKNQKKQIIVPIFIILSFLYGIYMEGLQNSFGLTNTESTFKETKSVLKIFYLDVGQADAILIQNQDDTMLIDAGNNDDGPLLVNYFDSLGILNFKYLIGTHPHEDHIGGLDDIINHYDIGTIMLPDAITTTKTFEEVLDAIDAKNMTYTVPTINETFSLGDATITVIYTGTDTTDLNNTSIVLKLEFGTTSFLFTGDATSTTENKILNKDIKADVLKVGHHGSKYSSTDEFLDHVQPKYAIISVGKNNNYGHPADNTIQKLNSRNIKILRTDELGTILLTSDGNSIQVDYLKTNTNGDETK